VKWEEFQSNIAIQLHVMGFIDHAHAAFTEIFEDRVVGNG
jgi:hypothetical protein